MCLTIVGTEGSRHVGSWQLAVGQLGSWQLGAYDLDGNEKWFVQLTPANPQDNVITDQSAQLSVDEQGNLIMLFSIAAGQPYPVEMAHLNAADGTLLP
jgi:hypothetical protein